MTPQLTVGIITCGRPEKVKKCLASVQKNVQLSHHIIVVDSMITDRNMKLYEKFPNIQCLAFDSPISPSAGRKLITENAAAQYILFLDDDIRVKHKSAAIMVNYLETHPNVDIVGGAWLENGRFRELGQYFNFGIIGDKNVVFKSFVTEQEAVQLGLTSVQVDGVQATMLCRREIFNKVQFDPQYDFYFELFDFFLQCHQERFRIDALPNVVFEHKPFKYISPTLRQTSDSENDRCKFIEKWGIYPVGNFGLLSSKKSMTFTQKALSFIRRTISRLS